MGATCMITLSRSGEVMDVMEINWAEYYAGWEAQSWKRGIPETASGRLGYRDRATVIGSSEKIRKDVLDREAEMWRWIEKNEKPKDITPWWKSWADCFRVMVGR